MSETALDPRNSVSVSASAGSGKTWQLISRMLRLLLENAAPSGLLALTFTRKAAAEMRVKLNQRLRLLARADAAALDAHLLELGLTPGAELRVKAHSLYAELLFTPYPPRAMTLHAFCQDLLNRFALEAGLAPGFTLLESDAGALRRAWRQVQSRIVQRPESAEANALKTLISQGCGEHRLEQLVSGFLNHRGDWWAYTEGQGEDQDDPAAYAESQLREHLGPCDRAHACRVVDDDAFTARLRIVDNYLETIGGTRYLRPERFDAVLTANGTRRLAALEQALYTQAGTPYKISQADLRKLKGGEKDHFVETHALVLHDFEQARRVLRAAETLERSRAAWTLGRAALDALQSELAREHALTFTDLEWRAYRLLRQEGAAEWVRYKLDQKIQHLLIDEFQDTSPTQWRLLLPLLEDLAVAPARSLFIVGDAKQSIYGFRRANPRLLEHASRWMDQNLSARRETLNQSRRSAPAIMDFVNALFEPEALRESLGFEPHSTHRLADWGRVELAPLVAAEDAEEVVDNGELRDPLTQPRPEREERRAQLEAAQVAQRIRALIESRVEVMSGGIRRGIGYGDVMVLARARTHVQWLERALTAAQIPFTGAARGSLLETAEARDLTALLRWLDAPHRDLELAQVLRCPLFSQSDESLIALARDIKTHGGTWSEALQRLAITLPDLRHAATLLHRWQPLAARLPAHDLLDRIVRDANAAARYEAALPAIPRARVRSNLGAFLQLALEADSGRFPSLSRFLRYLEEQARSQKDAPDEAPPAASAGQVRLLTIHAAKGLEAPAVFLINGGRLPQFRAPRWLVEWPDRAQRPADFLATGDSDARDTLSEGLLEEFKQREAAEDLNLLYVAVTRARQFLHISGFQQVNAGQRVSWYDHAAAAMEKLGPGSAAPLAGIEAQSLSYGSGEAALGELIPAPPLPVADPRLRQLLPAMAISSRTPSAQAEERQPDPAAPSASAGDKSSFSMTPAAATLRGTGIHFLLQRLSESRESAGSTLRTALHTRLNAVIAEPQYAEWLATTRQVLAEPELARFFDSTRYRQAWNEVPVLPADAGETGIIDRLVDDGETLWVLDYKTHAADATPRDLAERYRQQLQAYASAVSQIWPGRPVRAGLVLTATRQWVEVM